MSMSVAIIRGAASLRSFLGTGAVLAFAACGGGGALVDAGNPTGPGATPGAPATPAAPSSNVVTTSGTTFSPPTITVAQGAAVTWQIAGNTHNVTFGSSKPTGGDIGNTAPGNNVTRTFPAAGTYAYECTLHSGMTGSVVVAGTSAPVFTSVAVTPATPSVIVGASVQLAASARDQNGTAMSGVGTATWTSSNNAVATVTASGMVTGIAAGSATITASVAIGGVSKTGSAVLTVAAANAGNVIVTTPNETFAPRVVTIGTGGTVTWQFSGARHNVTFGVLKPAGGDVPDIDAGNAASRTFASAGTYDYQCTRHSGMTGQVVVSGGAGPVSPPPPPPPANPGSIVQATPSAFTPERIEIAPGGTVTWEFSGGTFGIVFEDAAPSGGNIPDSAPGSRVSRTFSAAGDYDYYNSKNRDVKGRIRVR